MISRIQPVTGNDMRNYRRSFLALAVAMTLTANAEPRRVAGMDFGNLVAFDIGAQSLDAALLQFSEQAGIQVSVPAGSAMGKYSAGLKGELSVEAALQQLLQGSGLTYRKVNDRTIAIGPSDATAPLEATATSMRIGMADDVGGRERKTASNVAAAAGDASSAAIPSRAGVPEVLVEGSRILNMDIARTRDDPQPYVIFDRKVIEQSGAANLGDFLKNRLTMNAVAGTNAQTVGGAAYVSGNQSTIDLRGLGTEQTLVLIDGRRTAGVSSFGTPTQPDINGLPLAAIERIEVLPTTASAIYGGSATGGVVNIIMRRDYSGAEVKLTYDNTFDGYSPIQRVDFSTGLSFNDGDTNVLFSGSYSDSEELKFKDRDFARRARERLEANRGQAAFASASRTPPSGATANIASTDGSPLVLKDGTELGSWFTHAPVGYAGVQSDGGAGLVANAGTFNLDYPDGRYYGGGLQSLTVAPEVSSVATTLRHRFSPALQVFAEGAYSRNRAETLATASLVNWATLTRLPASSPSNPFQQEIKVLPANTATKFEANQSTTENIRAATGVIVTLPNRWMAEADYTWSRSRTEFYLPANIPDARLTADVLSGAVDPLRDPQHYPYDLSPYFSPAMAIATTRPFDTELEDVTLRVAGPIWRLPGGDVRLTAMLEHRVESIANGAMRQFGVELFLPEREQTVQSIYTEVNVPLIGRANAHVWFRELELQISARLDEYETEGVTPLVMDPATPVERVTNRGRSVDPLLAVRYQPVQDVTVRVSYGTGFLPPSVSQLLPSPPLTDAGSVLVDPKRGGTTFIGGFTRYSGGDPELEPEESKTVSAGLILTPRGVPELRLSLDWTRIRKDNIITMPDLQTLLDFEDLYGRVRRAAALPGDPEGWAGPVIEIDSRLLNAFSAELEAVDMQMDYGFDTGRYGTFSLFALATRLIKNELQQYPNSPALERTGLINTLKWRANAGVNWAHGEWNVGWTTHYFDSYYFTQSHAVNLDQQSATVPSQIYHDLTATWRPSPTSSGALASLLSQSEITLGVRNVLNESPPIIASSMGVGYSQLGDPRMASYWLSVRKAF